ncbi:SCY1 family protein kinase [Cavenderia fasciculata]|uniref:SCY1 family protein kinase n=1 Tax=Cavenderia fasciculata TaxID=261658 RepID=F4PJK5_CACFS|nr:SCY1 family protein kinase [Cavenderia fasciculata]EGG23779.1 SCY1 family protein kinase [Cavenderia fasciculata]|eukprot:XP_004361630.1 SCY1 family protein kinase [Cavenderia fasciculata]
MEGFSQKVKGFLSSAISPVKDYDLREVRCPTRFWKIHDAIKKSSSEETSVFYFEKKSIEKLPKANQTEIIDYLKKEAQSLQRLRHPAILQVVSPIEETKTTMYFATEPILATLDALIQQHRSSKKSNQVSSVEANKPHFTFEELEIQLGISQLIEGVHFLNQTAKLLHRNISPKSIFITKTLKWKIGGLGFSSGIDKQDSIHGLSHDMKEYGYDEGSIILPDLDYLPPEYVQQKKWEYNSDLFSIGRIISEISLNLDRSLDQAGETISKMGVSSYYLSRLSNAKQEAQKKSHLLDSARVCTILLGEPSLRGDVESFVRSAYFSDVKVKSLVYLANIVQKEEESRLQFFRGLLRILTQFSSHIQINYLLPTLIAELSNERTLYVVLPCILAISKELKKDHFMQAIAPNLKQILTNKEPKNEVLACILESLETIVDKSTNEYIKKYVLPIVLGTMCGPTPEIIFQCLNVSTIVIKHFDHDAISHGVVPRLTNLVVGGFPLHIRTKSIQWFSLLIPLLDKKLIEESMLPNLEKILSIDNSPPILEALVFVYEAISKKLGGELLALKVLPALIPMSADKHIDLEQFKTIMKVVKDVLTAYEAERLNELNNLKRYTKSPQETDDKFERVINPSAGGAPPNSSGTSLSNSTNPFADNGGFLEPTTSNNSNNQAFGKITLPSNFISPISSSSDKISPTTTTTTANSSSSKGGMGSGSVFDSPDFTSMTPPPPSTSSNTPPIQLRNPSPKLSYPNSTNTIPSSSTNTYNNTNNNNNNNNAFSSLLTPLPTTSSSTPITPISSSSTSKSSYPAPNYNYNLDDFSATPITPTTSSSSSSNPMPFTSSSSSFSSNTVVGNTGNYQNTSMNLGYNPSSNYNNNNMNMGMGMGLNSGNSSSSSSSGMTLLQPTSNAGSNNNNITTNNNNNNSTQLKYDNSFSSSSKPLNNYSTNSSSGNSGFNNFNMTTDNNNNNFNNNYNNNMNNNNNFNQSSYGGGGGSSSVFNNATNDIFAGMNNNQQILQQHQKNINNFNNVGLNNNMNNQWNGNQQQSQQQQQNTNYNRNNNNLI